MRRFLVALFVCLCLCMAVSFAEMLPLEPLFEAVEGFKAEGVTQSTEFLNAAPWMSALVRSEGQFDDVGEGVQYHGITFDVETGEQITFEDIFTDADAAVARIQEIAEAFAFDNAYAERNETTPIPQDNFIATQDFLTIYYPISQFSYFSGHSGGFSFYAYELEGLLREDIPLQKGAIDAAGDALTETFKRKSLPGFLTPWAIGSSMADADAALTVVDVPDLTYEHAVYRFEAPEMRGVSLLSRSEEDNVDTAVISGIMSTRIDFSGLCTGIATKEDCIAALGEPAASALVTEADGYSRLPVGETLSFTAGDTDTVLEMHFVDSILYSVSLLAG